MSARDTPTFRDAADRHYVGTTFDNDLQESANGAPSYHRVRPGYPLTVIDTLTRFAPRPQVVVDIGAGIGRLTTSFADVYRDATLLTLDPFTAMWQALVHNVSAAGCLDDIAECMRLESDSVDVAACAQTWHRVGPTAASREFARVLRADGTAMLVWNTLNVPVPWVHRLSHTMHTDGMLRLGFYPEAGPELELIDEIRLAWEQTLTIEDIVLLAWTRSYWLRSKSATCAKVEANLRWYLHEYLGRIYEEGIILPYQCDVFYFQAAQTLKLPSHASQFSLLDLG